MTTFQTMALSQQLQDTLEHMQFTTPTPIQEKAIPVALEGKDILGSAQTGTGKTGAFGIPLIEKLMSSDEGVAVVMTPTRELATQVHKQLEMMLGRKSWIKSAILIGGESMHKQFAALQKSPRLIVGTPGRINDHLDRGTLKLKDANFLVLDETDRMLDMGFSIQIENVIKRMAHVRQTLLFSATLPKNIVKLAEQYLSDPVRIAVDAVSSASENIEQETIKVKADEKYDVLLKQLYAREGSVIMFVKTKFGADKMAVRLTKDGFESKAIHGDLRQNKRDRVLDAFRKQKFRILVATDVASRGIDVPHIEHVINFDLPQCPEDYIHRIGRTGRAGAKGSALCLITSADKMKWNAIERLLDPSKAPEKGGRSEGGRMRPQSNKKTHRKGGNTSSFGKSRSFDKPHGKVRSFDKPRGEGRSFDKPRGEGRSFDKPRGEGRSFDKPRGEGRSFDKPRGEGRSFDKPRGEGRSFDKPRGEGRSFDKPRGEGRSFDKPRGGGRSFDKPRGEGRSFDKPRGGGRSFDKPRSGGRSFEDRPRRDDGRSSDGEFTGFKPKSNLSQSKKSRPAALKGRGKKPGFMIRSGSDAPRKKPASKSYR